MMAVSEHLKLSGHINNQLNICKMKKRTLIPVVFLCVSLFCGGQAPHAFKYQAVIRDTTGAVISNQLVSLRVSVLKGDIDGEVSYSEIHDVKTNTLGLVNLEVGRGLVIQGDFAQISWGTDNYFIQLEIDMEGAMNYQMLGASQLLAVPYALYAEKSGSGAGPDTIVSQWKESAEGIYYDEGNVGINQTDPQYSLDMNGVLNVNGEGRISNTLKVGLNNFNVTSEGNVGIGTSLPVSNLQIEGTSVHTGNRRFLQIRNNSTDNHSAVVLWMNAGAGSSSTFLSHHAASYSLYEGKYTETSLLWNDGQGLFFRTRPESMFIFETYDGGQYSDPVELMRITGDGKLGIGTENPEAKLQIEGETYGASTERNFLWLKNNSTDYLSSVYMTLSSGGESNTMLHHMGDYYSYNDVWRQYTLLWNQGRGIILRSSIPGIIHFEFYDGSIVQETARFTSDGRMGVGTKDPQRALHVSDVIRLDPRSSPPENPAEGDIYMDGSDHRLKVYDGTTWQSCWE
jgi:hypothetical protein